VLSCNYLRRPTSAHARWPMNVTTLNGLHILYHIDLMTTPPYISLFFPVITLDTISTPCVVLFLYMITDPRNLNKGVPLPVDYWSAGPHTTTKSAYYTNDNITREHNKTHAENFWSTFTYLPLSHTWHTIFFCRCNIIGERLNVRKTE